MLSQLGCPPIKLGMFQPNVSNFLMKVVSLLIKKMLFEQRFNVFFDELIWYTKKLNS